MNVHVYQYIYRGMLAAGLVAVLVWSAVAGYAPFGVRATHLAGGSGLVLSGSVTEVERGMYGAFRDTGSAAVHVIRIDGAMRQGGDLQYYMSAPDGQIIQAHAAQAMHGVAYVTLPGLGFLASVLSHPVGIMGLIGVPLIMFCIDLAQKMLGRVRRFSFPYSFINRKSHSV